MYVSFSAVGLISSGDCAGLASVTVSEKSDTLLLDSDLGVLERLKMLNRDFLAFASLAFFSSGLSTLNVPSLLTPEIGGEASAAVAARESVEEGSYGGGASSK